MAALGIIAFRLFVKCPRHTGLYLDITINQRHLNFQCDVAEYCRDYGGDIATHVRVSTSVGNTLLRYPLYPAAITRNRLLLPTEAVVR